MLLHNKGRVFFLVTLPPDFTIKVRCLFKVNREWPSAHQIQVKLTSIDLISVFYISNASSGKALCALLNKLSLIFSLAFCTCT